ncbi:MAG: hypothetical protein HC860_26580 [Alkalinema sp. RU_4_3]|nr:hypothetical protein [Alkalinema sp. RU_4_3]
MKTAALALPGLTSPQRSKILIVDRQNRGDYTSIADAISQACDGCLIVIRPGRYDEDICIERALMIIGDDGDLEQVEIVGHVICECDEVILQNLMMRQSLLSEPITATLTVRRGKLSLQKCTVQGGRGLAIQVCHSQTQLVMRDCVVEQGKKAIHQDASTCVELNDCEIRNTEECGIFSGVQSSLMLHRCQVHSTLGSGIFLDHADRAVIDQCQVFDTGEVGILVKSVVNFLIQETQVYQHQHNGICLRDGSQGMIKDCEVFNNGWPNVAVLDQSNVEICRSKIREGLGWGIKVSGDCRLRLEKVLIESHNGGGIWLVENSHADLQYCEIAQNNGAGLWLEPKSGSTGSPVRGTRYGFSYIRPCSKLAQIAHSHEGQGLGAEKCV